MSLTMSIAVTTDPAGPTPTAEAPDTGLPYWSVKFTVAGFVRFPPAGPVSGESETVITVSGPATAVAAKATDGSVPLVTGNICVPAEVPAVRLAEAVPSAIVVA